MKRMLYALEALAHLYRTLYQSQLPTKLCGEEFVNTLEIKPCRLQKRRGTDNFF